VDMHPRRRHSRQPNNNSHRFIKCLVVRGSAA
jgi:hypothetical protein